MDNEVELFALPTRMGGMGIRDPIVIVLCCVTKHHWQAPK